MKIGIHHTKNSFSDRWIAYCIAEGISYKIVDCYKSDIIEQLSDCDAFMWHFSHLSYKDNLFAKQLIYSIEAMGKKVFPDSHTMWHFDDKLGQKYLFESINAPYIPTHVFYSQNEADEWTLVTNYPKVFKLRKGAGSLNVQIVNTKTEAKKIIRKAFGKGFPIYNTLGSIKERERRYKLGSGNFREYFKGFVRLLLHPKYSKYAGKERGYVYFQDFIPGGGYDLRVIVIGNKAFAIKRLVRENDFRASGSGKILYEKENFDENTIQLSFSLAKKLNSQCVAFDFIYDNDIPKILEVSYCFTKEGYDLCPGYWEENLIWNEGKFNPYGWMIDNLIGS